MGISSLVNKTFIMHNQTDAHKESWIHCAIAWFCMWMQGVYLELFYHFAQKISLACMILKISSWQQCTIHTPLGLIDFV